MTPGESIRFYRKRAGVTMEQLAERLGIRSRTVARWETGETNGWLPYAGRIAVELGVEEGVLYADDAGPAAPPPARLDEERLRRIEERLGRIERTLDALSRHVGVRR